MKNLMLFTALCTILCCSLSGQQNDSVPPSDHPITGPTYPAKKVTKPPKIQYSPDPEYTPEARKAKIEGRVVLWLVVDEHGNTRDLKVTKSLDPGLDQKAIEAVSKWRFKPAMVGNTPVKVQINVEVNFRL